MDITHKKIEEIKQKKSSDCIIFLSGPTSLETPLKMLHSKSVVSVNGNAGYLMDNNIKIFAYVVCDGSFYLNNKEKFKKYTDYAEYTFISNDVLNKSHGPEKRDLLDKCFILNDICKSRGGPGRKLRYTIKSMINKNIFIKCSAKKKEKTIAFSTDISYGHFGSATVAFSALQIAITFGFERIVFSGLDLNGECERFYKEKHTQPTNLPNDFKYILESFTFLRKKYRNHIFNLSKNTAIPYEIIPFLEPRE
ncbi:3-deoxy-D-manno-oct-2-ulosonate III transferase WaaZ [Citrobacter freundii]|uniref:3-deoxy-D-manno-oct-2-ulosonate III transferase WaaZ n=1 Tax=Citrobacter portucalensis TaxID=1639133 RepID=UPI001D76C52D|nr:3-deoxy-D-manno-oct-2-ulosonate III transferase WaaZ [Citrobacter freundii]